MIETYLTHDDIIAGEPALDEYLRSNQIDFNPVKDEAFRELLTDFKARDLSIRKLCKRLIVEDSGTKTVAFTGTTSAVDNVERLRLNISVTAITGNAFFTFQGTNDEVTYYDLFNLTISKKGLYHYLLTEVYESYRLNLISIGTTITYSAYMNETIYDLLHLYKTRYMIYRSLMATQGDIWQGKFEQYLAMYTDLLNTGRFIYDSDDDESIDTDEANQDIRRVYFAP